MRDGFVKVAAVTPKIRVADTKYNAGVIVEGIREAAAAGAKVIVLPELVITGYTCSDLFLQEYLLEQAKRALGTIAEETAEVDAILFVGLPLAYNGKLYNVAAVLCRGEVLGFVPKTYLPNYNEFYEDILPEEWQIRSRSISRESACRWGRGFYLSVRPCRN
mgnify:CR=1 FL=1